MEKIITMVVILAVIPLIIYLQFFTQSIRKTMKKLAVSLGWDFNGSIFSEAVTGGEYNGISTQIRYWRGSRYSRSYFKIELDAAASFEIRISKENFMHKLGKKTGLAKEIETGDQSFDDKYFIRTSDDYNAQLYVQKASVRETVTGIVDTGFTIDMDRQKIRLTACVMYNKLADVLLLKTVLDNVYRLIKELP